MDVFRDPAFAALDPRQIQMLRLFMSDVRGKSVPEALRMYKQLNQQIMQIKAISPAERKAIEEALLQSLPEADRQKVAMVKRMMLK